MLLYHGSAKELKAISKNQARVSEGVSVPQDELLDAIYLTSDLGFAIAAAVRPKSMTHVGEENGKKYIEFEHPELFDPAKEIFVYEIDAAKIPKESIRQIDGHQWVVEGFDEIRPDSVQRLQGEEVLKYYELRPWRKEGGEAEREIKLK